MILARSIGPSPKPAGAAGRRAILDRVRRSIVAAGAGLALAAAGTGQGPIPALAASPAPVAAASPAGSADPGGIGNIEVWLDRVLPTDTPAGRTIPVGMTLWDTAQQDMSEVGGVYLLLHPASGKAKPAEAETRSDWPGHLLANVIVPRGGPGVVEVGVIGRACTSDGSCKDANFPFRIAGTGPPPDAPRSRLVSAIVRLPAVPAVAGRPMDVVVDLAPRADWGPADIGLPDRLIVIATFGNGPDLANTEIHPDAGPFSPYRGQITIPETGDVALVIAIPGNGGADDVIQSATTRVRVGAGSGSSSPAATTPATDDGPPWPLIGGAVAVIVVAGFVIRRVFADL